MIKLNLKSNTVLFVLSFLLLTASCGKKPMYLHKIEGKQINIDSLIADEPSSENLIKPYRTHLDAEMNQVLAYAPQNMTKSRHDNETLLGNFLADLCYKQANPVFHQLSGEDIDFVLLNIGGIRTEISKGDVKVQHAYEVMPFENNMVVASLDYDGIQDMLLYLAESGSAHPISKQLRVIFENNKVKEVMVNNQPLSKNKVYHVLTSDYLINGGDSMFFFKKSIKNTVLDYKIRTALIDELKEIDTIPLLLDQRMIRK